jgi:2-polyprenyl-3-methyl-5-hydroxy-6-metoxy-1,4-benzoquinol methylase
MPQWSARPEPAEMVACVDVLEHIEPDKLENVLDDLRRCVKRVGFFSVSTVAAEKILSDGRNAHLIIEPPSWWLPKIQSRWDLQFFQRVEDGFFVIVTALAPRA